MRSRRRRGFAQTKQLEMEIGVGPRRCRCGGIATRTSTAPRVTSGGRRAARRCGAPSDGSPSSTASSCARASFVAASHRHLHAVVRKHVASAAAWLHVPRDGLDDGMRDLERLARPSGADAFGGAIEPLRQCGLERSCRAENVHRAPHRISPASAGRRDDLASDPRRRRSAVAGVLDDDREGDLLRRDRSNGANPTNHECDAASGDFRRAGLARDAHRMARAARGRCRTAPRRA